jgi:hypothetical protein
VIPAEPASGDRSFPIAHHLVLLLVVEQDEKAAAAIIEWIDAQPRLQT